jgi:DNA-binding XRE family transcriptional regulator/chaperonin cofactor prefoldin
MGCGLWMHDEIREWLTGLRETEPELARLVGESVLALLDAGDALGPPLAVPLESGLPPDPREGLDVAYERQLTLLQQVRRGVADVATSRKRVELQISQLEQSVAKLARQREDALAAGQQDLATDARTREGGYQEQLSGLRAQLPGLTSEEQKLAAASQRLQAKVEAFRVRKETLKATYTAAEASWAIRNAFDELDAEAGDQEARSEEAGLPPEPEVASAEDEIVQEIRDLGSGRPDGAKTEDRGGMSAPPGMMELRPGAPGNVRAGLLFVVESHDTAVLLTYLREPCASSAEYQQAVRTAAARLPGTQSARPPACPASFTSYDPDSFLDEFFPGAETEVEIGASALVARSRAHTLAEARQRLGLTQAQVARRMNVRQERVSAIERAAPGATEIRTLAAYVRALGGRLEAIAAIGDDRIKLM